MDFDWQDLFLRIGEIIWAIPPIFKYTALLAISRWLSFWLALALTILLLHSDTLV